MDNPITINLFKSKYNKLPAYCSDTPRAHFKKKLLISQHLITLE
jgi:hypothetical protein